MKGFPWPAFTLHSLPAQLLFSVRPTRRLAQVDPISARARPDEGHRDAGAARGGASDDQEEPRNGGAGQLHAAVVRGEDRGRSARRSLCAARKEAGGFDTFGRAVRRFVAAERRALRRGKCEALYESSDDFIVFQVSGVETLLGSKIFFNAPTMYQKLYILILLLYFGYVTQLEVRSTISDRLLLVKWCVNQQQRDTQNNSKHDIPKFIYTICFAPKTTHLFYLYISLSLWLCLSLYLYIYLYIDIYI